jgi:competence protein ComEC
MRSFIVGFASGIWLLQMQRDLPAADVQHQFVAAAIVTGFVAVLVSRWSRRPGAVRGVLVLPLLACGATAGFLYATQFAERRMADELPAAWEGLDIAIVGIVSGLPAINQSDRSLRCVRRRRIETPGRRAVADFAGLVQRMARSRTRRARVANRCPSSCRRALAVLVRPGDRMAMRIRTA